MEDFNMTQNEYLKAQYAIKTEYWSKIMEAYREV